MEELEFILQEYVLTANAPEYGGDYSIINSKFPELANIDPKILEESEEWTYNKEGGLSYPALVLKIKRPKAIAVTYQDQDSQQMLASFSDLSSRCFCHEMEHMDGYTFLDHVSDVQLKGARKKQRLTLRKIKRREKRNG